MEKLSTLIEGLSPELNNDEFALMTLRTRRAIAKEYKRVTGKEITDEIFEIVGMVENYEL
jgi:hypothetical protein